MKISKYFSDDEIACKCGCGFKAIDPEVLKLADDVREFVGMPITPSSGCRCASHNAAVGGEPNSYHMRGMAIDLPVSDPKAVYKYLTQKYGGRYGFGLYKTFVHVDCRPGKGARWKR
jgi:uncharacterized protein YcbK (DUF882 family)